MYRAYQDELHVMFQRMGWEYWSPLSIVARLGEEYGELAREVNHHYGDKKKRSSEAEGDMEEEMGDIIYTLVCFSNSNGYDMDLVIRRFQKCIVYYGVDPMSILAELHSRTGIFAGVVSRACVRRMGADRRVDPDVEEAIGGILRVLQFLASQIGCTLDVAFRKSINKVAIRDKDRFPDGR